MLQHFGLTVTVVTDCQKYCKAVNYNSLSGTRFGARHNIECADLKFDQGGLLHWSSQCRYLGVYTSSVGEHLSVRLITLSVNSLKRLMQFLVKLDGSPLK